MTETNLTPALDLEVGSPGPKLVPLHLYNHPGGRANACSHDTPEAEAGARPWYLERRGQLELGWWVGPLGPGVSGLGAAGPGRRPPYPSWASGRDPTLAPTAPSVEVHSCSFWHDGFQH